MTCQTCEQWPCTCTLDQKPRRHWLIQTCPEPGCTVQLRSLLGHAVTTCRWHQTGTAYNSDQIKHTSADGPLMSKDEFSGNLFEAIHLKASAVQCQKNEARYLKKGLTGKANEEAEKAQQFEAQVVAVLSQHTLTATDVKRILTLA